MPYSSLMCVDYQDMYRNFTKFHMSLPPCSPINIGVLSSNRSAKLHDLSRDTFILRCINVYRSLRYQFK